MTTPRIERVAPWVARAPDVPAWWFRRASRLHGENHTRRVHVHAQRLLERLRWDEADARLVLRAALWHDIGRETDGVEPPHGARGAARADELGLTAGLAPDDAALVRFAITRHSLPDGGAAAQAAELAVAEDPARCPARPERALRILWLLKDADALDRVRLGFGERADPRQLRHPEAIDQIGFADRLYAALK
ncbi:MAG TPA: HD domain-containing protein [Thermoleophilia bacterium]|nr:HD domain-containing protein [Thermoleophilia bacterium]